MTFKIDELKEKIKYIVINYDGGPYGDGVNRVVQGESIGILGSNGQFVHFGMKTGNMYRHWEFTCEYPSTIEDAARILDAHCPGWETKVKDAEQDSMYRCVLGQLYDTWQKGIRTLFNINLTQLTGEDYLKYGKDTIFGNRASNDEWQEQISLRLKKKYMTFWEAMQALTSGKKVRRTSWHKNSCWELRSCGTIYYKNGTKVDAPLSVADKHDWELFTQLTFKDLKAGDKFIIVGNTKKLVKAIQSDFAISVENALDVVNVGSEATVERIS